MRKFSFAQNFFALVTIVIQTQGVLANDKNESDLVSVTPNGIDHLVFASADIERGMDDIESLLGVRPVRGGHHPQYGTHNALLSLGPGVYLEVIARDPELPAPQRGALIDIPTTAGSQLVTWVFRTEDIRATASGAANAAIGIGKVESGSRTKPDGSQIKWQLTDPYAMPLDGAVPFLINWGSTLHPSLALPSGGRLLELVIEHPEPDRVQHALSVIGADIKVLKGDEFRLAAKIATKNGIVTLN